MSSREITSTIVFLILPICFFCMCVYHIVASIFFDDWVELAQATRVFLHGEDLFIFFAMKYPQSFLFIKNGVTPPPSSCVSAYMYIQVTAQDLSPTERLSSSQLIICKRPIRLKLVNTGHLLTGKAATTGTERIRPAHYLYSDSSQSSFPFLPNIRKSGSDGVGM